MAHELAGERSLLDGSVRRRLGSEGFELNGFAANAVDTILRSGTRTFELVGTVGTVIQYRINNGWGARWTLNGVFVGFISP